MIDPDHYMQDSTAEITIDAVDRILSFLRKKVRKHCSDRHALLQQLNFLKFRYTEYCALSRQPRVADLLKLLARIDTKLGAALTLLELDQEVERDLIYLIAKNAAARDASLSRVITPEDQAISNSPRPCRSVDEVDEINLHAHTAQLLQSWRHSTAELRKLIAQSQTSERTPAGKRGAKLFEEVILNHGQRLNYFNERHGPETSLIAFDIYISFQMTFRAPVTWQNDLDASPSGGDAVRFATAVLSELDITHPHRKQPYTPAEIIAIWRQNAGRSHSDT